MSRIRELWAKLPAPSRIILTVAFWLPVWFIAFGVTQVLIDEVTPGGATGIFLELLIYAALAVLVWFLLLRPSADRAHGGPEKRRAFQSTVRTGVIHPDADRGHLTDAVTRFSKNRKYILIIFAVGIGLMVVLPLVTIVLNPPLEQDDLVFVAFQAVPAVIILGPMAWFIRRRSRQLTALKKALDAEEPPASERNF